MKSIFKKIALLGATVMALASCASLLPNRSHRSRSSSDEIYEASYQGNGSQFINPSSPSGGRSSSSKSEVVNNSQYYLQGPAGTFECAVDEESGFEYNVISSETGMAAQISSFSIEHTGSIETHGELQNNNVSLWVYVTPYDSGVFEFNVEVTDIYGRSFFQNSRIIANRHNFDSNVRVEYQSYAVVPPYCGFGISFNVFNMRTGETYYLDKNHPFDVGHINESVVKINNFQAVNTGEFLNIDFESVDSGIDLVELKLIMKNGSTYNITIYIEVRPEVWFEQSNPLVIPYNDYIDVTFEAFQNDKYYGMINAHLDLDKTSVEVHSFAYEILDFSSYKITLRIYNNTTDYGDILIRAYTEEGFYYEWGCQIVSERVYETERWVSCNIEYVRYKQSSKMVFFLEGYFGRIIIKDIDISFKNGKIDNLFAKNVYGESYEYHFVPTGYGDETMHVSITSEEGYVYETECSFYIDQ